MGGREDFNQMMDSVFVVPPIFDDSYYGQVIHEIREMQVMDMGNYAHGNQPIQHMVYLYAYSGQPWKTQYRVRQVMDRLYSAPSPTAIAETRTTDRPRPGTSSPPSASTPSVQEATSMFRAHPISTKSRCTWRMAIVS